MSKRKQRNQERHHQVETQENPRFRVIEGGAHGHGRARTKTVNIMPRNFHQDDLLGLLEDDSVDVVFAIGPAGTGKTLISTLVGVRHLMRRTMDRFVVTRPTVSVDEQLGFLPGTLQEKMAPWTRPIFDVFEQYYTPEQLEYMLKDGRVEIAPLAYMRGRTFHNSFIIADECQNCTPNQMKMLLTRIGEGSKMVITGDLAQHDRGYENNGLKDFLSRIGQSARIQVVQFDSRDIERHPVVEEVLKLYGDE